MIQSSIGHSKPRKKILASNIRHVLQIFYLETFLEKNIFLEAFFSVFTTLGSCLVSLATHTYRLWFRISQHNVGRFRTPIRGSNRQYRIGDISDTKYVS